jgi:hypothetical protein
MCKVNNKVAGIRGNSDAVKEGLTTIACTASGYVAAKYGISQVDPAQRGLAATSAMVIGAGLPMVLDAKYQKDSRVTAACAGCATAGFEEWAKTNMKDFATKVGISGVEYIANHNQYMQPNYGQAYIPEYAPRIAPAQRQQFRIAS